MKILIIKDKKGRTILHYAVGILDQRKVRLLNKKGADVNAADLGEYKPLHLAVMGQRVENTKELIKARAEVNVVERSNKFSPLHFACMVGDKKNSRRASKSGSECRAKG